MKTFKEIDIKYYDNSGNVQVRCTVPVTQEASVHYELMQSHYCKLSFNLSRPTYFLRGDFIETPYGRFELIDLTKAKDNDTIGYSYEIQFDAYYRKLKNKILKYRPNTGSQESTFSLTSKISTHIEVIMKNLAYYAKLDKSYLYDPNFEGEGTDYTYVIDASVDANAAKLITYSNTSILDAIANIAQTFGCEWWFEGNILHFGTCENTNAITDFRLNDNIVSMSSSQSQSTYANRVYAFGAARNLPSGYKNDADADITKDGVVEKRLMLPNSAECSDKNKQLLAENGFELKNGYIQVSGLREDQYVEGVTTNDDIYPRNLIKTSKVTSYEKDVEDESTPEEGDYIKRTFYRVNSLAIVNEDGEKTGDMAFRKAYILSGKNLHIVFQSGSLNGMDFECEFNPDGVSEILKDDDGNPILKDGKEQINPKSQVFEIVANEDYGRFLPDITLHPKDGDTFVLYNWDSTKLGDTLVSSASNELLTDAIKDLKKSMIDPTTYTCTAEANYSYNQGRGNLHGVGDRVNLYNKGYGDSYRASRIIGYEFCLDIPYDGAKYYVGEKPSYSRLNAMESKIEELVYNGQSYLNGNGGSGRSIYIIKSYDSITPTDYNVFSAKAVDEQRLNKTKDDTAKGTITWEKVQKLLSGLLVGNFNNENGGSWTPDTEGRSHLITDYLEVRMKAIFEELVIKKTSTIGGKEIISPAGGVVAHKVEEVTVTYNNVSQKAYRCYFLAEQEGDAVDNDFSVNDQVRSESFNVRKGTYHKVGNHFYWRLVIGRDEEPVELEGKKYHYIDLSDTDCATASDVPAKGDVLSQCGNRTDVERQNCLIFSAVDTYSPFVSLYHGINSYSFANKEYVEYGVNKQTNKAFFNVYGDMYVGDRPTKENGYEGSSYIKYDSAAKQVSIKGKLSAKSTVDGKELSQYIKENSAGGLTEEQVNNLIKNSQVIADLQNQVDGAIETWFYDGVPTLKNAPASSWTTDKEKDTHLGDLYYDNKTGKAYRFAKDGNTYKWTIITDTDIAKALSDASKAQETADGKMKVFSTQPIPPYQLGDIWVNATYPTDGSIYKNEILRCQTAKAKGSSFAIADWTKASKYTDDSALNTFKEEYKNDMASYKEQLDEKVETWFYNYAPTTQNKPASDWTTDTLKSQHAGDLFYNTSNGYTYRWTGTAWARIKDNDINTAMTAASKAQDTADGKRTVFTSQPTVPYDEGDLWASGGDDGKTLMVCVKSRATGSFTSSEWVKANDSDLNAFAKTIEESLTGIRDQLDKKAETWYQPSDPSTSWTTDDAKKEHKGDLWYNTSYNQTFFWNGTKWDKQDVPTEVFDKIDGKSSIYVSKPASYEERDLWILEAAYTLGGVAYSKGELVVATKSNASFSAADWTKKVKYTDDTVANAAKKAAEEAKKAADTAQTNVTNLGKTVTSNKKAFDNYVTDGYLEPSEIAAMAQDSKRLEDAFAAAEKSYTEVKEAAVLKDTKELTDLNTAFATLTTAKTELVMYLSDISARYNAANTEKKATIVSAVGTKFTNFQSAYSAFYDKLGLANAYITSKIYGDLKQNITDLAGYKYIKDALGQTTDIDGGLVMTTLLALRDADGNVQSGINGAIDPNRGKKSIATWWGGQMVDKDYNSGSLTPATSLVRFDGSGYLANGAIWWDVDGKVHADPTSFIISEKNLGAYLAFFEPTWKSGSNGTNIKDLVALTPQAPFTTLSVSNDLLVEGKLKLGSITLSVVNGALKIDGNVYSTGGMSAYGEGTSNGGGLNGSIVPFDKAKSLTAQNEGTEIASAWSIKKLYDMINSIDVTGQLTDYLKKTEASTLYQPKGNYLTSHQDISGKSDKTHTHSVKINGVTKTIAATGGTAVDLGTYLTAHQSLAAYLKSADAEKTYSKLGHTHAFSEITGKPTTLAGYGVTDGVNAVSVTGNGNAVTSASIDGHTLTLTKGSTFSLSGHTHTFASLTSKPTTIAGYGITDAYTKAQVDSTIAKYLPLAGGTITGALTVNGIATFKSKVAIGDIYIINDGSGNLYVQKTDGKTAANFYATGGITAYGAGTSTSGGGGLNASVISYARIIEGSYTDADLTSIPNAYAIKALSSRIDNIATELGGLSLSWNNITGKPSTFAPSAHTHKWAEITDRITKVSQLTNDAGYLTAHQSLASYYTKAEIDAKGYTTNKGTVTSVALTLPTGLTCATKTITTSGTFAISLASGYSIPTTAKQTAWDGAVSAKHTHSNKSVLDGISSTKVSHWDSAYGWYALMTTDEETADGIINKWNEVVSFLANIAQTDTLSGIVDGINKSISDEVTRAKKAEGVNASGISTNKTSITTLQGYFTSGSAKKALQLTNARKLWGNSFNGTADINGSIIVPSGKYISIGNIKLEYDAANKALKITNTTTEEVANLYTSGGVSAYGVGASSSSGGGLNGSVKAYADAIRLTTENLSEIASAYSVAKLYSEIQNLASAVPSISVSVPTGGNALTGATYDASTGVITFAKGTFLTAHQSLDGYVNAIAVSGSGNAVTAVTKSGKTITFTKGATYLTSHQSLSNYYTKSSVDSLLNGKSATTHTHSVKINGITKTIAASGGDAVDLGTYLTTHQSLAAYATQNWVKNEATAHNADMVDNYHASGLFTGFSISDVANKVTISIGGTSKALNLVRAFPSGVGNNFNDIATHGNSMGMSNIAAPYASSTANYQTLNGYVNPNGQTGWHHYINLSYTDSNNTATSPNMWQTQFAIKAGTTEVYVRSRAGGKISNDAAWAAPWVRLARVTDNVASASKVANALSWSGYSSGSYNGSAAKSISIPNNTNQLTNGAGFITASASISGNAGSATKLQNSRTINGTSFNGTANIVTSYWGTTRKLWGNSVNGNADVNGSITIANTDGVYVQIGDVRLVYDKANTAIKVVKSDGTTAANFYATGGITAYGEGSGSSGGGGLNGSVKSYADALKLASESLSEIASAYSIKALDSRISSLEGGSATSIETTGSGNAVTSVSKSGTKITFTKGSTFSLNGHTHDFITVGANQTITATQYTKNRLSVRPYYNSGGPTTYGNILEVVSGNSGGGQLSMEWSRGQTKTDGTDTNVGKLYYRSKRDNMTGWTVWKRLAFAEELAWGNISGKPTSLSGYGITDGVNAVSVTGSGNAVTAASVSGHTLTLTKGSSFSLSNHTHYIGTTQVQGSSAEQALTGITKIDNILKLSKATVTVNTSYKAEQNRLVIYGNTYGNDANYIKSARKLSYGDGGPQLVFSTSENPDASGVQSAALVYTDHDTIGAGVSLSFVTNQGDAYFIAPHIKALTAFQGNLAWSYITNKPTTLSGFGITDGLRSVTHPSGSNVFVTGISTSGTAITYTKSYTKKSLSVVGTSGWTNASIDGNIIPDMSFIAHWNGAYSGTSSNLAYCNKGAFGSFAIKNSLAFSELTSKPTTISGYGITDAYTKSQVDAIAAKYLPLTGGTLTGQLKIVASALNGAYNGLRIGDDCYIGDCNFGNTIGLMGVNNNNAGMVKFGKGGMQFGYNGSNHIASTTAQWTNLNADLLDGWHKNNIVWSGAVNSNTASLSHYWAKLFDITVTGNQYDDRSFTFLFSNGYNDTYSVVVLRIRQNGAKDSGAYNFNISLRELVGNMSSRLRVYYNNATGNVQLFGNCQGQYGSLSYTIIKKTGRTSADFTSQGTLVTNTSFSEAQSLPATTGDSPYTLLDGATRIGIVKQADQLVTARSLWGQSFNGTANVSGNMTGVGNINTSAAPAGTIYTNNWFRSKGSTGWYSEDHGGGWYMTDNTWIRSYGGKDVYLSNKLSVNGNVGIGTTAPSHKLHVSGEIYTTTKVNINGIILEKDSNGDLKVNGNLYATGGISAYGTSSAGSGGGLSGSVKSYSDALKLTSESLSEIASAYSIKQLSTRITSLEGGSATSISVSGSGNAVTSITKNGTTISVVKGSTFSLSGHTHKWADITDRPSSLKNPSALSWSGYSSGSYDGSVAKSISIPNNTNQLTNGAGFITASASITGNAATATKVNHSLSVFGKSFNGSADVTVADTDLITSILSATANLTDKTEILTSYASDNGFNDSNAKNRIYKRPASAIWGYINSKTISNADKLDNVHLNGIFTALSNTNNGVSMTIGTVAKSLANMQVYSATKLVTARNIALNGDLMGNANFDGSANITIYGYMSYCNAIVNNTNTYPWRRIAKVNEITGNYSDGCILLYISEGFNGGCYGIARVCIRTDNLSTGANASCSIQWISRNGYGLDSLKIAMYKTTGKAYYDVFLKMRGTCASVVIRTLQDRRGGLDKRFILVNSTETSNAASHTEAYATIEDAATAIHNQAYTSIAQGSDVATVHNADMVDGIHANGLFTNLSNSGNSLSITVGGTNKTLTVNYASNAGNADTLDGVHASGLFTNLSNSGNNISITIGGTNKTLTAAYATNCDTVDGYHAGTSVKPYGTIPVIGTNGVIELGHYIDFHHDNTTGSDYSVRLQTNGNHSNVVTLPTATGTLALTSDNVASATKLQTTRTLWGQSFNGTANISGSMTGVGDMTLDAGARIKHGSGNLYIGNSDNSNWIGVQDICSQSSIGDGNWSLRTSGAAHFKDTTINGTATIKNLLSLVDGSHKGLKMGSTYISSLDGEVILQGNTALRFGNDAWDYNQWAGLKYDHSSKTVYLGIADGSIFKANSAQSGGVINLKQGISSVYTPALYAVGDIYHTGVYRMLWKNSKASTYLNVMTISQDDKGILSIGYGNFANSKEVVLEGYNLNFRVGNNSGMKSMWLNYNNGNPVLSLDGNFYATGGVTAYKSSDERLKHDIHGVDSLAIIKAMGGTVAFRYNADNKDSIGWIAQRVLHNTFMQDLVEKDDKGFLKINYWSPKLIAVAFGAIEQVDDEVSRLKRRVRDLENEVEQLKSDRL